MAAHSFRAGRQCTRFTAGGTRCTRTTLFVDSWCRECDGFARPEPEPRAAFDQHHTPSAPSVWQRTDLRPCSSEEAYAIGVSYTATIQFIAVHGGDRSTAEPQIRSLLEDLLLKGGGTVLRHPEDGRWRLRTCRGKLSGKFSVLLDRDASVVIGYRCRNTDRTYAQMKAGVASRTKAPRPPREKAWFMELQHELPITIAGYAARQFARLELGLGTVTRDNAIDVIRRIVERWADACTSAAPPEEGQMRLADGTGLVWTLVCQPGKRPSVQLIERITDDAPER